MASPNGKRQIARFFLPGDLIFPPRTVSGATIETLTDCRFLMLNKPRMLTALNGDEQMLNDTIMFLRESESAGDTMLFVLGQLPALERLVWLILHLHALANERDKVRDQAMAFPLTQLDLAEALGLSLVHVNKSLAKLRREGVLVWDRHQIHFRNMNRLQALCSFPIRPE